MLGWCSKLRVLAAAGGLCLLAAALDDTRKGARAALQVLCCLLDNELLPAEQVAQHEAELADLSGLLRCSVLMGPAHTADHDDQGMSDWNMVL